MVTKKAKVIMLPTEDKNPVTVPFSLFKGEFYKHLAGGEFRRMLTSESFIPQHLYITTDDEIKEDDWCIHTSHNKSTVIHVKHIEDKGKHIMTECGQNCWGDYCKKIIATTDKSLTYWSDKEIDGFSGDIPLPQPSKAFIEKYCKVGGIDEVLIEYGGTITEFQNFCSNLGFSYDSAFGWYENSNPGHRPNTSTLEEKFNNKLKIDSHNTITIHSIKDSWTREELYLEIEKHL